MSTGSHAVVNPGCVGRFGLLDAKQLDPLFQLVLDPADARAAMARFAEHLLEGGTLIMPWIDIAADQPGGLDDRFDVGYFGRGRMRG